jgi:hypothetical protein
LLPYWDITFSDDVAEDFVYDGPITPSADELDGGRFWTLDEIRAAFGQNVLTPNFESEFKQFYRCLVVEAGT